MTQPEVCPHCGADVPANARVCPNCGADEETGWSEEAQIDRLDLPNQEDFNYEEFVEREFGEKKEKLTPRGIHWFWWGVALVLLIVFVVFWVRLG